MDDNKQEETLEVIELIKNSLNSAGFQLKHCENDFKRNNPRLFIEKADKILFDCLKVVIEFYSKQIT